MTKRRILHAADIHLDSPLKKLDQYESAPAERIRHASRRALANLTKLAIESDANLVVVSGDLYDGDWPDQNTGLAFVEQASELVRAGIPILVIRGNHDAANLMTSSLPLPKNPDGSEILLSSDHPETRLFDSLGIAVHGQSFSTRAETANLAAGYPAPIQGMFNLGLLHTGLEGSTAHAHYAPCTPAELTDKEYDYWALGHIHKRGDHALPGGAPIVFSGNIQGRHIGEQGAKGCVLIEIDETNRCSYEFRPLDILRWHECVLDVSEMRYQDEIIDAYQQWIPNQIDQCGDRLLVARVRLVGESDMHDRLHHRHQALRADLQAVTVAAGGGQVWLEDVKVKTSIPATQVVSEDLEGPLESLSHVIDQMYQSDDLANVVQKELEGLIRKLPKELKSDDHLNAFPIEDNTWIRELIDSAAADVRGRLRGEYADVPGGSNE